jgi:hypothetical protein
VLRLRLNRMRPLSEMGLVVAEDASVSVAAEWLLRWVAFCANAVPSPGALPRPPAVVFDVDATLVRYSATSPRGQAAVESVCQLYRACVAAGALCFVVTARADGPAGREELVRVLRDCARVPPPRASYLRPPHVRATAEDLAHFKRGCRRCIEEEHGVTIVGNIGDSWHDLLDSPFTEASRRLYALSDAHSFVLFPVGSTVASVKLPAV